jgi:hypothetical protein
VATLCHASSTASAGNLALVHEAASAIRYLMDHPLTLATGYLTTSTVGVVLASIVFGREEADDLALEAADGAGMSFSQQDIDEAVSLCQDILDGTMPIPLQPAYCDALVNLTVSDTNKLLLTNSPQLIPAILLGLFIDEDHPRGEHATHPALATEKPIREIYQRKYAEAIGQLALSAPGHALLQDSEIKAALQQVAQSGLTDEAKLHAKTAQLVLKVEGSERRHSRRASVLVVEPDGQDSPRASAGGSPGTAAAAASAAQMKPNGHIMLSYNWICQSMIKRIHQSLLRRSYIVWVDIEQMKRDTMDMMSEAIEGAEVVLYGVCNDYKESINCRMEAQYAMQTENCDMVPLMMESTGSEGAPYKPTGWLGLLMGARMYYRFIAVVPHDQDPSEAELDEAAFEEQMGKLCLEIGDRGKQMTVLPEEEATGDQEREQEPVAAAAAAAAAAPESDGEDSLDGFGLSEAVPPPSLSLAGTGVGATKRRPRALTAAGAMQHSMSTSQDGTVVAAAATEVGGSRRSSGGSVVGHGRRPSGGSVGRHGRRSSGGSDTPSVHHHRYVSSGATAVAPLDQEPSLVQFTDGGGGGGGIDNVVAELSVFMREQLSVMEKQQALLLETRTGADRRQQQMETAAAPREAITAGQMAALQARLEAMHTAEPRPLLTEDELAASEDAIADYIELQQSLLPEVITAQMINVQQRAEGGGGGAGGGGGSGDGPLVRAGRLHRIVGISDAIISDGAFARQVRRKLLVTVGGS